MTKSLRIATLVASGLAWVCCATPGLSQVPVANRTVPPPGAAPSGGAGAGAVAVIDISHIFKNHNRFKKSMEDMKRDVDAAEASLRNERKVMEDLVKQLQSYQTGSPDFKRLEEDIAVKQSQLQLRMNLQKKEFLEREAKVYYNVYTEISNAVQYFAQRHRIAVVLRYNSGPVDPDDRAAVLQLVNKAVVYQDNVDITYEILDMLNGSTQPAPSPGPGPVIPRR